MRAVRINVSCDLIKQFPEVQQQKRELKSVRTAVNVGRVDIKSTILASQDHMKSEAEKKVCREFPKKLKVSCEKVTYCKNKKHSSKVT